MPPRQKLTTDLLLTAYAAGYFPMADMRRGRNATIDWFSPDPRAIIPLHDGGLHIPRSLAKAIRRSALEITSDEDFERVMRECAAKREGQPQSVHWISDEMIKAYTALHMRGHAHSLEAWRGNGDDRQLVGGIYGVSVGSVFFAESMFCRPDLGGTDASKVCLIGLVDRLRRGGYTLLDVQLANPHTVRLGAVEIDRAQFLVLLAAAIGQTPSAWDPGTGRAI